MVLESTIICVDNSEFMRNGDYIPNRLQAQQDAVNTVCHCKLMANPENNVGLLTLANSTEVLATLTTDGGKILTSLHKVQPSGFINLLTGIRIAHLALKHRQSKNHKMRIVAFVGSPITSDEKEMVKIAKRLKKENVNIDIINFGETEQNQSLLEVFINTINGREGTGSHLVTIPPSPHLADALLSSPIIQGEDGTGPTNFGTSGGFDFGVDPNEDPELALALRVSMEEQRQRQQEEERRAAQEAGTPDAASGTTAAVADANVPTTPVAPKATGVAEGTSTEEQMLQQALAMSLDAGAMESSQDSVKEPIIPPAVATSRGFPDFSSMTEEEQIAYAMQISLQGCQEDAKDEEPMEVDDKSGASSQAGKKVVTKPQNDVEDDFRMDSDFSEVMSDPAFLQDVLQSLPGVDPDSSVIREAVGSLTSREKEKKEKKEKKKDEGKDNNSNK